MRSAGAELRRDSRHIYAAHWAAEHPDSVQAATTALTVAAGHPALEMHLSYVPRQPQTADGELKFCSTQEVSAEPQDCSVGASHVAGAVR